MSNDRFFITKITLVFLLIFFFFGYLGMRYFSPKKSESNDSASKNIVITPEVTIIQEPLDEATISPQPLAKLNFNSSLTDTGVTSYEVGRTVLVDLIISEKAVSAADIVIIYDPQVLEISEIQNGEVFDIVLKKTIDSNAGTITFSGALTTESSTTPKLGKILSFSLTPRISKNTTLSIDPKASVLALSSSDLTDRTVPLDFPIVIK